MASKTYHLNSSIDYFFTDTGPVPQSSDYTTLVALHGTFFNGYIFEKLHHYAHSHNVRVVLPNRRDHRGSSPFTETELEELKHGKQSFLDDIGKSLYDFLSHLIETERIPKISSDRQSGGIVILGWSAGVISSLTLLQNPDLLDSKDYTVLQEYIRDLIFEEPPNFCLGIEDEEANAGRRYNPFRDPDYTTMDQIFANFKIYVSSYYNHPALEGDKMSLDFGDYDARKRTERATSLTWSKEEDDRICEPEASIRSEFQMITGPILAKVKEMVDRVCWDPSLASTFFPKVRILYICGIQTASNSAWTFVKMKSLYDERLKQGASGRHIKFVKCGGNHFMHWDEPDKFLGNVVDGLKGNW